MISRFRRRLTTALGIAILGGLAPSCTVGPNYTTPRAKVAGQWMANPAATPQPPGSAGGHWWRHFEDPVLNELVETAYRLPITDPTPGLCSYPPQ
jgi:hypothetical protein